jgi:putative acetyltransferase
VTKVGAAPRLDIAEENPDQPEVVALIQAADVYLEGLYPPEQNHLLDIAQLKEANVTFLVARLNGEAVGCGAMVRYPGYGEIKRMFVAPDRRGHGIGRQLIQRLEQAAAAANLGLLRLETGTRQPEALGLYRAVGYVERGPFGDYRAAEFSLFMEKRLE